MKRRAIFIPSPKERPFWWRQNAEAKRERELMKKQEHNISARTGKKKK